MMSQWEEVPYDAIEVSDARFVRSEHSQYADVYFEVVNEGSTPLCFVHAEMTVLDADGAFFLGEVCDRIVRAGKGHMGWGGCC